jgi:putative heme iron utilization protein
MRSILLSSIIMAVTAGAAFAQPQPAPRPAAMCASTEQAKQVGDYYKANPGMMPANGARALKMAEAVMVSGLPKDQAAVVSGAEFAKVWDSMTAWPTTVSLIMKGGNVFEIPGKIMPGEASTRSNFFNIKPGGSFVGHLRPDLVSTIAVVAIPGKDGAMTRGTFFYDGAGEATFGVFTIGEGGEGSAPTPAGVAAFDKTLALAKSLPKACN